MQKNDNRGGYREGAGRPKKDNPRCTTVSFVCTAEEKILIDEKVQKSGLSRSKYIVDAIKNYGG